MKRLFLIAGLAAAFLLLVVAACAQKANFAGTWNLDKSKSQGLSPRMQGADSVTWTITQDDKTISIDQKVTPPAGGGGGGGTGGGGGMGGGRPGGGPQTYALDGKEATNDVTFGQATGKVTTKGTVSGGGVELMRKTSFPGQDGTERVSTTTQKLSLSGDGKTLTVVAHSEGGRGGPSDSTMVFNKQ
jgi:hypothetical protein